MNLTTTPLLIIGAALPRTATTSIAAALEQLGYHVFHATTWNHSTMGPIWRDLVQADMINNTEQVKSSLEQWIQQLSTEGFNATLDQPSCFVYDKLIEYYPNAKVLKTQRTPSSWARSMVEMSYTLDLYMWQPPFNSTWNSVSSPFGYWSKRQLGILDKEIHPRGIGRQNATDPLERRSSVSLTTAERAYVRYQEQVKQRVPSDKLLTFHPKEGWPKLCRHFLPAHSTCPPKIFLASILVPTDSCWISNGEWWPR